MPASTVAQVKRGRVTKITRVHEDREIVRVEREGAEPGSEPIAEVVQQRQTRATVNLRDRKGKKTFATLPAPGDEIAAEDVLSTQEAEELLSEAEELLNEPVQGGKVHTVAHHEPAAGSSEQAIESEDEEQDDDGANESQHQIEEMPHDTVHDEHDAPHVEEPESSVTATTQKSAPAKSHGIIPKVQGLFNSIVHRQTGEGASTEQETTSKERNDGQADKAPKPAKGSSKKAKASKQAALTADSESEELLEEVAEASPAKKGRAAAKHAKRAAAPTLEAAPSSKRVQRTSEPAAAPATPAKVSTGQKAEKASSNKASKSGRQKGSRQKKRAVETYRTYIYKVLKEVHPDVGISKQGMQVMNTFATDMFDKIVKEAAKLTQISKKATLSSREIQTAVRLLMPGELAKHAITEGTKAVTKATSGQS